MWLNWIAHQPSKAEGSRVDYAMHLERLRMQLRPIFFATRDEIGGDIVDVRAVAYVQLVRSGILVA